jgi:hypothetical protein
MVPTKRLRDLAQRAARGKRRAADVARFLIDIHRHCADLAVDLAHHRYQPGRGRSFWIEDPKRRCIFALPFRDRVVQHLLVDETLETIERGLAAQSYACRVGKGTHRALTRAADLTRHRNFVLRLDIRRFFPSIDHALLRSMLQRTTPPPWRWLRDLFLDAPVAVEQVAFHFAGDDLFTPLTRPHGLPIGSLTSQIWANVYLSPIDHLLGSALGLGTFVRYSDDLLVFDDDPGRLREALARIDDRLESLRLRLHPQKTRLHRTTEPVSFLGFVLQRHGDAVQIRLRHDNVVRMRQRMARTQTLFAAGALEPRDVMSQLRAWLAHARHGHTRALLQTELERLRFSRHMEVPSPAACPFG